jgi:hypothetical protein
MREGRKALRMMPLRTAGQASPGSMAPRHTRLRRAHRAIACVCGRPCRPGTAYLEMRPTVRRAGACAGCTAKTLWRRAIAECPPSCRLRRDPGEARNDHPCQAMGRSPVFPLPGILPRDRRGPYLGSPCPDKAEAMLSRNRPQAPRVPLRKRRRCGVPSPEEKTCPCQGERLA